MRDYDYHPNELDVRVFGVPEAGVLVRTDEMFLGQTREPASSEWGTPSLVLRHYAFAGEWFKLNATLDDDGELIETGAAGDEYVVNCDIATPLRWIGPDATAVDLFLDVLVRRDGSYRIVDRPDFDDACSRQLISGSEARNAESGLKSLLHWITSGRLQDLLDEPARHLAAQAPPPLPFGRSPLVDVPAVAPHSRSTW
ncbi:DUF402 domain-containing protein [Brachybacterium tyrofermentans]|uniref:DUF402 domain-containing protein n=1 Tax=Brachybacterium tyrofermentans TaxID=47848 RepID=UPI003F8FCA83